MGVRTIGRLLRDHPFFSDLTPEDLDLLEGCGRNVAFPAEALMFREGEPAERFFIIRTGRVALEVRAPDRGAVVVDTVGPGDVVGVSWLIPPYRWQFDGRAVEPVRAVALDGECLRRKCEEDPRLGFLLMTRFAEILERRLRSARIRLLDLYRDARAR